MKKTVILVIALISVFTTLAQESTTEKNPRNNIRQGFGTHNSFDLGLGFVNPNFRTDGSAYFFEDWDTEGVIYTKDHGSFKIKKININLFDNKLEAIYDESSVYTFDTKNLMKIVINNKVFRVFEIDDELKIFQLVFKDSFSVYKYYHVIFSEGAVNPMLNRSSNKYIKNERYFLYRDKNLTKMKLSKKAFSKLFQSDNLEQQTISDYIQKSKLSLKKEEDLIKALQYITR
ncbi:hypothetical protein [uncultured Dokdonia sp.]|uniref:hypothetical protein n=1 Tax=uncultured Dokdonia sp. TaxID=575653 RepID=UPI00261AD51D|nr:hypothetical protein [uncultured Dokdonia sp.]